MLSFCRETSAMFNVHVVSEFAMAICSCIICHTKTSQKCISSYQNYFFEILIMLITGKYFVCGYNRACKHHLKQYKWYNTTLKRTIFMCEETPRNASILNICNRKSFRNIYRVGQSKLKLSISLVIAKSLKMEVVDKARSIIILLVLFFGSFLTQEICRKTVPTVWNECNSRWCVSSIRSFLKDYTSPTCTLFACCC